MSALERYGLVAGAVLMTIVWPACAVAGLIVGGDTGLWIAMAPLAALIAAAVVGLAVMMWVLALDARRP